MIGVKRSMATLFVITALKMIPLSLVVVLGITRINPDIFIESSTV